MLTADLQHQLLALSKLLVAGRNRTCIDVVALAPNAFSVIAQSVVPFHARAHKVFVTGYDSNGPSNSSSNTGKFGG